MSPVGLEYSSETRWSSTNRTAPTSSRRTASPTETAPGQRLDGRSAVTFQSLHVVQSKLPDRGHPMPKGISCYLASVAACSSPSARPENAPAFGTPCTTDTDLRTCHIGSFRHPTTKFCRLVRQLVPGYQLDPMRGSTTRDRRIQINALLRKTAGLDLAK